MPDPDERLVPDEVNPQDLEARRRTLGDEHPKTLFSQRSLDALLVRRKAAEKKDEKTKNDEQQPDKKK